MDFLESLLHHIKASIDEELDKMNPVVEIPQPIQDAIARAIFKELRLSQALPLLEVVIREDSKHARSLAILCRDAMMIRDCACNDCKSLMLRLQGVIVGDSN